MVMRGCGGLGAGARGAKEESQTLSPETTKYFGVLGSVGKRVSGAKSPGKLKHMSLLSSPFSSLRKTKLCESVSQRQERGCIRSASNKQLVFAKPNSLLLCEFLDLSLVRVHGPPNRLPRASLADFDVVPDCDKLLPDIQKFRHLPMSK